MSAQDEDPGGREDYNRWAARWMTEELDEEDLEEWNSGRMTDHVFSLMDAVGIEEIQIAPGPEGRSTVVVADE